MIGIRPLTLVCCFAVLNLLDLVSTWLLVGYCEVAYEANPIGSLVLRQFGWIGLCIFKFAFTVLPLIFAWLICLRDPRSARFVIRFGIGLLGGVVIYHCILICGNLETIEYIAESHERVRDAVNRSVKFQAATRRADLLASAMYYSDLSLSEAVEHLVAMGRDVDPVVQNYECVFGSIGRKACLAADLLRRTIRLVDRNSFWGKRRLNKLTDEFRQYDRSLPFLITEMIDRLEKQPRETGTICKHRRMRW